MNIKAGSAIIGYGETVFAKAKHSAGRSHYGNSVRRRERPSPMQGLPRTTLTGWSPSHHRSGSSWSMDLAEYLQLRLSFLDTPYFGGAAGNAGILHAAAAIHAGLCRTVLLVGGSVCQAGPPAPHSVENSVSFERDFRYHLRPDGDNSAYALIKRRYQHEFGARMSSSPTGRERPSPCRAVSQRPAPDPRDRRGRPEFADDLRPVADVRDRHALHRGNGMILTSSDRARDAKQKPVYLLGADRASTAGCGPRLRT